MKFVLRIIGTWLVGLALVLILVDGVQSISVMSLTITSLDALWSSLHLASYEAAHRAIVDAATKISANPIADFLFAMPAWAIFGLAGLLFLLLGRRSVQKKYAASY